MQQFGAGFGLLYGALLESFKNPPQPRPTDKVVLKPVQSTVMTKAATTMGRQSLMLAGVSAVYSAGEVRGPSALLSSSFVKRSSNSLLESSLPLHRKVAQGLVG